MQHPNIVELEVWGPYGLFSDPLMRVGGEKNSYQIPTYEALKGILSSVYWKPTIIWYIDMVRVMNPIQTEVKGIRPIKYNDGKNDLSYDMNKDKAYMKKGENYTASPWKMVYVDENYYLLAFEGGKFKHFRVDKMENVTELNMPREGGDASGNLDMSDYNKHIFGMYGGEVVPVTMVFLFKMMGAVMDKFGHDIMIMKEDEKHFRITVPVAVSQQFYGWVFGLGKMARIVAPESVKQKMRTMLTGIAQKYEDE